MGSSPHVRQTAAAGLRDHAGEPATVAFRRPSDRFRRWRQPRAYHRAAARDLPVVLAAARLECTRQLADRSFRKRQQSAGGQADVGGDRSAGNRGRVAGGQRKPGKNAGCIARTRSGWSRRQTAAQPQTKRRRTPPRFTRCLTGKRRTTPTRPTGWSRQVIAAPGAPVRRSYSLGHRPKPIQALPTSRHSPARHPGREMPGPADARTPTMEPRESVVARQRKFSRSSFSQFVAACGAIGCAGRSVAGRPAVA